MSSYKFHKVLPLILLLLSIYVLVHIPAIVAWADLLPETAAIELLEGRWDQVLKVLQEMESWNSVCSLVAAHACLATNRNNESLLLMLSPSKEDLYTWLSWSEKLHSQNQMNPVAIYLYGDALVRSGDLVSAELRFTEALDLDPDFGLAWVARGTVRALIERTDEAYMDLIQATMVEPTLADAHASLGCLEVMLQNAEGAEDAFNKALNINPDFALAFNGRGCARYGLGKPDEASLDFDMADISCPALVITEANQTFVMVMVAEKIDEKLANLDKPGTTLVSHSQTLSSDLKNINFSSLESSADVFALAEKHGYEPVFQAMAQQKQDLIMRNKGLEHQAQQLHTRITAADRVVVITQGIKAVKDLGIAAVYIATSNVPGLVTHGAKVVAKDALTKAAERNLPKSASEIVKFQLATTGMLDKNTAPGLFDSGIQAVQSSYALSSAYMQRSFSTMVQGRAGDIADIRQISKFEKALALRADIKKAADAGYFTNPSSAKPMNTGVVFSSSQPWSQMPDLYREISSKGPESVIVLGQDPIKSFAFEYMANRHGIHTLTTQSLSKDQFESLGKALGSDTVVGFKFDRDDINRMMVPPPWFPPGGGGGGVAYSAISGQKTIGGSFPPPGGPSSTSYVTYSGSSVRPITPDLLLGPKSASVGFDSLKPWTPKGDVGGVRTEDLDWVFVDKGNWPVMTFFSLLYEPPQSGEDKKSKED